MSLEIYRFPDFLDFPVFPDFPDCLDFADFQIFWISIMRNPDFPDFLDLASSSEYMRGIKRSVHVVEHVAKSCEIPQSFEHGRFDVLY